LDRTDIRKAFLESKGTALSYITSWSSGDVSGEEEELEIGDDEDIDYDDYKDIKPGEEGLLDREKGRKVDDGKKEEKEANEEQGEEQGEEEKKQTKDSAEELAEKSFLSALQSCTDMVCIKNAHKLPKGDAKFNFPHFLIIGFQKAATTSLHVYVIQ
jgi:hypothetical protein